MEKNDDTVPEQGRDELQHQVLALLQKEVAVTQDQNLLSVILSTTAALVVILDGEGRIVLFNSACETLTGYSFEEVRGHYLFDLFIREEERDSVKMVFRELSSGRFPGENVNDWLTRNGDHRLIHWMNTSLIHPDGAVAYIVSTGIDITEIKKVEEKLRVTQERLDLAIKGSGDGLWDWSDVGSNYEWWSPRFYELLGYGENEIASSSSAFRWLVHPEDRKKVEAAVDGHLGGDTPYDIEIRMKTKTDGYHWFRSRGRVIRDGNGEPIRMAGSLMDIMDQKLAEEALSRRTGDLIRANKALADEVERRNQAEDELRRQQHQVMAELDLAAKIQNSLIPSSSPNIPSIRVAWRFEPSDKIGGDTFNYQYMGGDTIGFYILDACGHGLPSALIAAAASQSIHTHFQLSAELSATPLPQAVLENLDRVFPFERFESFFSIIYLAINHRSGRLRYCCAGHPPPLLLDGNGALEVLDPHRSVIGFGGDCSHSHEERRLEHGDRIFLYTDGLVELVNPDGLFYGKDRLFKALRMHSHEPVQTLAASLQEDWEQFSQSTPPEDDLSLLVIEYG